MHFSYSYGIHSKPRTGINLYHTLHILYFLEFPTISMKGCSFHWCQATWRHVQALGLQTAFTNDLPTNKYIKQILGLPYLPHQYIQPCLDELKEEATTQQLQELCTYVQDNWMDSTVWPPSTW